MEFAVDSVKMKSRSSINRIISLLSFDYTIILSRSLFSPLSKQRNPNHQKIQHFCYIIPKSIKKEKKMQSGKVVASIQTIVNDLKPITYKQVIYEAVTNSLQANATDIKIKFIPNTERNIDSIIVEDNGDGFNQTNTKSFREYRSTYKKHFGCKGIG